MIEQIKNIQPLAKGKRGLTYTAEINGQTILIKTKNPDSDADTIKNEAEFLKKLNTEGIGPKFIAYEKGKLIREYVEGIRIDEAIEQLGTKEISNILKQVLNQCRKMDLMGINKQEMTNPYKHVLITKEGKAIMIDFERCKETKKPKNVTQFCQYLAKPIIREQLEKKGIRYEAEKIKELATEYKRRNYSEEIFKKIINLITTG